MNGQAKAVPEAKSSIPAKPQKSQGSSKKKGNQEAKADPKVKRTRSHKHAWGISKRYSPDSVLETCSCGAARKVTRIAPHRKEIIYLATKHRVIKSY